MQTFMQRWKWVIVGLVAAALVVVILAPVASGDPDGLDRVSEDKEFAEVGEDPRYEWLPDYSVPGVDNEWASVVLAGLIGVGIAFLVPVGLGYVLRQGKGTNA
jgi:hypothetical protein